VINHNLRADDGIEEVIFESGKLEASDFEDISRDIDPYIEKNGRLKGMLFETDKIPGFKNFAAVRSRLRFLREHVKKIERVALVTDSRTLSAMPKLANHFIAPEFRSFDKAHREDARRWLKTGRIGAA
jgi:hypothetical protein